MKLLFDQNISYRVSRKLRDEYPDCHHVNEVGLDGSTDRNIWDYAKKEDFAIVSFDADFSDLAVLRGSPPKVIWLRLGNVSTQDIIDVFISHKSKIELFLNAEEQQEVAVLEITRN